jgi:uncharacterized protein
MPLKINLHQLDAGSVHLDGELAVEDFAADFTDPLIAFASPLAYDLEVQAEEQGLLLTGELKISLRCTCGRCLKTFAQDIELPGFAALAPLEGEEALTCEGEFADLTPLLREDIYLALPTNPLCRPDCRGLARKAKARDLRLEGPPSDGSSPWGALDQLKL